MTDVNSAESLTRPNPGIVEITRPPQPRLTGVTLLDAEPFGDALQALGVPQEYLGAWRIMSAPPTEETDLDDRTVVVNPAAISAQMDQLASRSNDRNAYIYAFPDAASHVILRSMAMQVRLAKGESMPVARQRSQAALLGRVTMVATYTSMVWVAGESPFVAMPVAIASDLFAHASSRFVSSPVRPANKLAAHIEKTNARIVNGLQKAVLPIYAK